MNFEDKIKTDFSFLFSDYNFRVLSSDQDLDMKDFIVIATGQEIKLRFIQDRVDFFLEISLNSKPEKWLDFYNLLNRLKVDGKIPDNYKILNKHTHVKRLLKEYFETINKNLNVLF